MVFKNIFSNKPLYLETFLSASSLECTGKFPDEEFAEAVKCRSSTPSISEFHMSHAVKLCHSFPAGLQFPYGRIKARCHCLKRNYLDAERKSFVLWYSVCPEQLSANR